MHVIGVGNRKRFTTNEHKVFFWDDANVLYLGWGDD